MIYPENKKLRIIKTKRKSISISVTRNAEIIVRAPVGLSENTIYGVIRQKSAWIESNLEKIRNLPSRSFLPGESFPFLGHEYTIVLGSDKKQISISGGRLEIPAMFQTGHDEKNLRNRIIDWCKKQAHSVISARCHELSIKAKIPYASVRITDARKRWGSCGPRGSLNFSWRLVLCPVDVIDYVVIHELAHILIRNHSESFWKKVEELMPDYRNKEKWLRTESAFIDF